MEEKEEPGLTPDELYDFIVQHMTPEQALRRLLQTTVDQYEELKGIKTNNGVGSPLFILAAAALEMGWQISIEKGKDDSFVEGLVLGTPEYLDRTLPKDEVSE